MGSMDVVEVIESRYFVMIHDVWEHFDFEAIGQDTKIEEEMTLDLHKVPEPYSSSYFDRRMNAGRPHYPRINKAYSCYRNVEGSYRTMEFLRDAYPRLVDVIDIGPSHLKSIGRGGREMKVLKLTNKDSNVSKAPLFVLCSIHPRELAPAESCARFAEDILEQYGTDADKTWILDHTEIHMVLQGNPDGRKDEEQKLHFRRKNMDISSTFRSCFCRKKDKGVDINRNFPHSKWGTTNEGGKCKPTYPGKSAGSEKETQAIVNYMKSVLPPGTNRVDRRTDKYMPDSKGVLLDIHSYGQALFWPYAYAKNAMAPNDTDLMVFAKKMASHTSPQYTSDNEVYVTSGDTTDWAYESIGVAAYTVEIGSRFHELCSNFENIELANVLNILLYAARVSHAPYQLPKGPDIVSFGMSSSVLSATDTLSIIAEVSHNENVWGNKFQKTFIADVNIFIDNHPFDDNAVPDVQVTNESRSMQKEVMIDVPMSGLSMGKHTIYVQIYDIQGAGPVYAKFIEIID